MCETILEAKEEGGVGEKVAMGDGGKEVEKKEEDMDRSQHPPSEKRARLDENVVGVTEAGVSKPQSLALGGGLSVHGKSPLAGMVSLSSGIPSIPHSGAVPGAAGLQFIPISLMSSVAAAGLSSAVGHAHQTLVGPPHHQNLALGSRPLPSFISQNFFNHVGQTLPQTISAIPAPLTSLSPAETKTNGGVVDKDKV